MNVVVNVSLEYQDPIGAIVGLEWEGCRVLTFARTINMDALPPVGTCLFMSGSDNPIDLTVTQIYWCDREGESWMVKTDRVRAGPAAEAKQDIAWMSEQGFKWCDKQLV